MSVEPQARMSPEEYLAFERESETRHEFLGGEVFAMSGASRRHNLITGNVFAALHGELRSRGCELYASDMRVRVTATGLFTYPDLVAVCEEPRFDDAEMDTLLNPALIIEVLSPSTEDYDRGRKFSHYRAIPSLADYLFLAQDRIHAELFSRQSDGRWLLSETDDSAAVLDLPSLGCRLSLAAAYERVLG